ncbi:hypothetical protein FACS189443_0860 [Planctomycetales bacterium]|nr:hypothetical protein FACS189443_0860 [Planctomycetales bacterium]
MNIKMTVRQNRTERFIIFFIFAIFGAWTVPDVNEVYYVGKAIHFWQPDWIPNDTFLDGKDSHFFFYAVFGWLSFVCSPMVMAWIGRVVCWYLLAWSWYNLSKTLFRFKYVSALTALAFAYYTAHFHEAGEWVIGGVEGKTFAYPFVFFALDALLHKRRNHCVLFLGLACAFHILVGGWALLIIGGQEMLRYFLAKKTSILPTKKEQFLAKNDPFQTTWQPSAKKKRDRKREKENAPPVSQQSSRQPVKIVDCLFYAAAFLLVLCGLVPALQLDSGTAPDIIRQAHQIYCFDRLQHHLVPYLFEPHLRWRFFFLTLIWIFFCRFGRKGTRPQRLFDNFIWGTLLLYAIGWIIADGFCGSKMLSAELLRFYWFRWADVAVPMGVSVGAVRFFFSSLRSLKPNNHNKIVFHFRVADLISTFCSVAVTYVLVSLLFSRYFALKTDGVTAWIFVTLLCGCAAFSGRQGAIMRFAKTNETKYLSHYLMACYYMLFFYFAIAIYAPFTSLFPMIDNRCKPTYSRIEPVGANGAVVVPQWFDVCHWIKSNTQKDAAFWIPRDSTTFKWYARRGDAGTWKNIPQDAAGIVRWRKSMNDLFTFKTKNDSVMTDRMLTTLLNEKSADEIEALRKEYGFEYIVCFRINNLPAAEVLQKPNLQLVYSNETYCVYQVKH